MTPCGIHPPRNFIVHLWRLLLSCRPSKSPCHRYSFTLPPGSTKAPSILPPTAVLRDKSLTCLRGISVRDAVRPPGRLAFTSYCRALYLLHLSLLPPLRNMLLPLNNQTPIKVLFPKRKEQFLLKDEFRLHFEGPYSPFAIKVFKNMELSFC